MDRIDRAIVEQLRLDARLPNTELADRVGLTPAPCLRRVRRLEQDGVITGYHAHVNPTATGQAFEVIVNVDLAKKDRATVARFESRVAAYDEVVEFRRMFGLPDYFLRIATEDLSSFEEFVTTKLEDTPGIARVDSHLTMKTIKSQAWVGHGA
ncbi:Lrp/AsnC family transcriptional regulator [Saccharothrix deserti]|uniref:Lrp/AsnC family transcriptional regulator n=1 Tax=Saccharothrix deserti TaxID=2593674 RepID=UPI00131C8FB2|nr:Lrp/AsnC family transcriptional regulator [Saccharothrix deserti]